MTRHSSLRPSGGEKGNPTSGGSTSGSTGHRVQFSLEHEDLEETRRRRDRERAEATDPNPISYSQWITKAPQLSTPSPSAPPVATMLARQPVNGIVESSFTGQPVRVMPPTQQQQQQNHHQQTNGVKSPSSSPSKQSAVSPVVAAPAPAVVPLVAAQKPIPPAEDEVRRWTEKKRSKSQQPRGSEIEELRGSSKAKPKSGRFFPNLSSVQMPSIPNLANGSSSSSSTPKRPSRVELYEADRRQRAAAASRDRFSFGKIFRQLAATSQRIGGSHGELFAAASSVGLRQQPSKGILDAEHEREIMERDRSKRHLAAMHSPPPAAAMVTTSAESNPTSIVHPVDLSSAVEVVPIRPHAAAHFAKNSRAAGLRKGAAPVVVAAAAAASAAPQQQQQQLTTTAVVTKSILKGSSSSSSSRSVEYSSDSKDSGHETSSVHSEGESSSSSASHENTASSVPPSSSSNFVSAN